MGKKSQKQISKEIPKEDNDSKAESVPFYVLITTYLSYLILIIFGKYLISNHLISCLYNIIFILLSF